MLLREIANNRVVIGMREDIDMLVRKALARDGDEAKKSKQKIVEEATKSARRVADLALHIAEMYGFAMSAMEQRNFNMVAVGESEGVSRTFRKGGRGGEEVERSILEGYKRGG